ncbi:hypothetical protein D3C79_711930 [compost metagenome]
MQLRQRCQPPGLVMEAVTAGEEQVGGRQAGDLHAGFGQGVAHTHQFGLRQCRELGHMANGDPALPAMLVGAADHLAQGHAGDLQVEVQVQVQVAIVGHRQFEQPADLCRRVGVGVRAAAQHFGAFVQGLAQQRFGPGVVEHAFLREHADLQGHGPGVISLQPADGAQAGQADAGVDLDMGTHVRGALHDGLLQHCRAARVHIGLGEIGFGQAGLGDGFGQRAFAQLAARKDAGLVQVDMGFDQAGQHQPAAEVEFGRRPAQPGHEPAVFDQQAAQCRAVAQAHIDQVQVVHAAAPAPR